MHDLICTWPNKLHSIAEFLRGKLDFPELWGEENHERKRQKVDTGGKHEEAAVAVCALEDVSCVEGDQEPANGPRHASDARDRTYGSAGKHIRDGGEEIGRPSLMRSSSDT